MDLGNEDAAVRPGVIGGYVMALQTRIPARDEAAEYYFRYIDRVPEGDVIPPEWPTNP